MTVEFLRKWGINGYFGDGELSQPRGIAIDGDRRVYVAGSGNHRIQVFAPGAGSCTSGVVKEKETASSTGLAR